MNIEDIRDICSAMPFVTEEIKWENDLCFMINKKMFCFIILKTPTKVCFKVKNEEFDGILDLDGIEPAPYLGRFKWVAAENHNLFNKNKWEHYIKQSYSLIEKK